MKKAFMLLLLFNGVCWAQNFRYDAPFPSITTIGSVPYLVANVPPNSPKLAVCTSPANTVPCNNFATTYTATGVACPNGAQDTPQPASTSTCQATGDAQGNIGFWAPAGTYDYTVCIGLNCYGPFTVKLSGGGGGSPITLQTNGTNNSTQTLLNITGTGAISASESGGTVTLNAAPAVGTVLTNPPGSQSIVQPVSGTGTTAFISNNLANVRWVTPSYNWSFTDVAGSLGNLTTAGTNLTITLPASVSTPCPAGIDTTFGAFALAGTGSISASGTILTMTSAVMFPNYVSQAISIPNAGAGNTTLTATIVSWTDSTHVVISTPAVNTVSGKTIKVASYQYKVLISGTGTTEAAIVTGGAAVPGASSSCTLVVNTQFNHPNGYKVSSASGGIQEAINDAWVSDAPGNAATANAPVVRLMAGTDYDAWGTIYVRGWGTTLDHTGGAINCHMINEYCEFVGNWQAHPSVVGPRIINPFLVPAAANIHGCSPNTYCNVSSISNASGVYTVTTATNHNYSAGPNGVGADVVDCEFSTTGVIGHFSGVVQAVTSNTFQIAKNGSSTFSAGVYTYGFCHVMDVGIEDNAEHLVVDNLQAELFTAGRTFYSVFVNENDQHAVINGGTNRGSGAIDNTYPTAAWFVQRTDDSYAGIMNITNYELTNVNCASFGNGSNGAVWRGGVCQAFPVFGIRYLGGLQPITIQDIYQEAAVGGTNPLYPGGITLGGVSMAYLFQGGVVGNRLLGTFPTSSTYPTFACSGTSQTQRNYYVQALNGSGQASQMMYIGSSQANCGGATINLAWPAPFGIDVASVSTGAISWHLWLTTGVGTTPPNGSASAILFNSTAPTCGVNGMCTFADTQAAPSSHVVPSQIWGWRMWFWPAPIVINNSILFADIGSNSSGVASSNGMLKVSVISLACVNAGSLELESPNITQCAAPAPGNNGASLIYQLSAAGGGPISNSKGVFNLGSIAGAPYDIITLGDSNFNKAILAGGYRPLEDAGDIALGVDQGIGGLSVRAGTSVSTYINNVNDNVNWKERLTSTAKTITVPLVAGGSTPTLSGTGACSTTGSQLGGKWAGSFACTGTTGAATVTITPSGTAPNGWFCTVFDRTAGTIGPQTGSSTTTCTATFTTVTNNDVLTFQAVSF